jgi:O-acetyl-ADP-ribose deacetylase (regulator of RNase III)
MATIYTKGDIFNTDGLHAYAFGSNAEGTMDTGIAVAVRKRWPQVAELLRTHGASGKLALGDVVAHKEGEEMVYALVLQEAETKRAKIASLTRAVTKLVQLAQKAGIERVGLARPGTGKAALDWPRVKSVLTEIGDETDVALVVFEQFVRAKDPTKDGAKDDAKAE